MHIEEIHDFESFLQLQSAWDDLCRRSQCDSFFLSHAWFRCCWLGKAVDERPFVAVARDGSSVVGLAPFVFNTIKWRIFPVRTVSLMQNQDSPFADVVLAPDRASEILQGLLDYLRRSSKSDVVSFSKISRSSPTHALLVNSGAGVRLIRAAGGRSPILQLDGDWNAFWTAQSQRFKKTVRHVANRVERLGRVTVEELSGAATAAECMQVFASVAARSWKAGLRISLRRNPGIARFFEALTSVLHASGRLLLWTLRVDGVPIATEYHVRDGDTVYALRSDFDERDGEASPGAYLNAHIIRTYFERGVRIYDMGPGDSQYKQRWANSARDQETFWLFRRSPYGLALYNMERRAVPQLRRVREWWRKSSDSPHPGGRMALDAVTPPASRQ